MQVLDYSQGSKYASFTAFILPDTSRIVPSGKYCIIGSEVDQCKIEEYEGETGYRPAFTYEFGTREVEEFSSEITKGILAEVPKIPKYKPVQYEGTYIDSSIEDSFGIAGIVPLYEDHESLALHIEIENKLPYSPACNFAFYPRNSDEIIEYVCHLQQYPSQLVFAIESDKDFTTGTYARIALQRYCDLTGLVRKPVLKLLSYYCVSPEKRSILDYLTSIKGKEEFRKTIEEQFLSIPELMEKFEIKIPAGDLVQILDRIKCRYYTVCSAPSVHNNLQIAVQVNKRGRYVGLASRFLENMHRNRVESISGHIKASVFELVQACPLLMVSAGCGIAPFRSLLIEMQKTPELYPSIIVICGFRTRKHFFYREEFERIVKPQNEFLLENEHKIEDVRIDNCIIDHLFVGYSREGKKVYVQDIINLHHQMIWESIREGAIYICGGTSMGKSVSDTLKSITLSNSSEEHWKSIQGRIKMEIWG